MKYLFIFLLTCLISSVSAGNPDDTTYVLTNSYEGIIWGKNYPLNCLNIDTTKRWNPTVEDIAKAEIILKKYMDKTGLKAEKVLKRHSSKKKVKQMLAKNPLVATGHFPTEFLAKYIYKDLENYVRQYMGDIDNKNRKILYIQCTSKQELYKFPYWETETICMLGGGTTSYWRWFIKVDIKRKKAFDFLPN